MTFPRIRPGGLWILGSVFGPGEAEAFDDHHSKAIDGYAGGAYAPGAITGSAITIGGLGVHGTGPFTLDDLRATVTSGHTVDFKSGSTLLLEAGSTTDLVGLLSVTDLGAGGSNGQIQLGGPFGPGKITVTGNGGSIEAQSGSTVTFDNGATFSLYNTTHVKPGGAVNFDGGSAYAFGLGSVGQDYSTCVHGAGSTNTYNAGAVVDIQSTATLSIGADAARTGADIPSGSGAYSALRPVVLGPSTTSNVSMLAQDVLAIPPGLAAAITYTLLIPAKPCRMSIVSPNCIAQAHNVTVQYNHPSLGVIQIATLASGAAALQSACDFVCDGTNIYAVGPTGNATAP